jgi:hypothetical protein
MRSLPPAHHNAPGVAARAGAHRFLPLGWPLFLGDNDSGYSPGPNVVVVEQPPVYVIVPQAPSDPPKPEIHEYQQPPAAPPAQLSADDPPAFAIVLKDGSVKSAVAVTAQSGGLYYVEPDGRHRLVSLDAVDREATRRLNRERKLQLQLPE